MKRRPLATRAEVADFLNVPVATLEKWAVLDLGPEYRRVGRYARYDWDDVERWFKAQQGGGGSAA